MLFCLFIPLIFAFLISLIIPLYNPDKYTLIAFPFFCILPAAGISNFNKFLGFVIILTITMLSSMNLFRYYFLIRKSYSREIAEQRKHNRKNNDIVVAVPNFESIAVKYYYDGNITGFPEIKEKIREKLFII